MRRVFLIGIAGAAILSAAVTARAQTWAENLLPERSFDAGTVARGSKVRHTFRLVNRLNQDVHIAYWKTKCGCTDVRVGARDIPPGTQTTIEAIIDTTKFQGFKPSGLTLVLDRPDSAEIDLNLSCFIRADLTLNPGVVDFGIVSRSTNPKPSITLTMTYSGGQPNWGIVKMQTRSSRVSAKVQEQGRSAGGPVSYLLSVQFDPADVTGFFKDEITLYTNDPGGQPIPVAVSAAVQSAVTVSPSPLVLGPIKAGQVVKRSLLVRSSQPFKVATVRSNKNEVTTSTDADEPRALHTVTVSVKAPTAPGPFSVALEIETDLKDEPPVKLNTFATIVP